MLVLRVGDSRLVTAVRLHRIDFKIAVMTTCEGDLAVATTHSRLRNSLVEFSRLCL